MLFSSIEFIEFFVVVYLAYIIFSKNHKIQNILLLCASYYFYSAWNVKLLSLIVISTTIDYFCAQAIDNNQQTKRKKLFLSLSIIANLSILGFFKYFNFFVSSFMALLDSIGFSVNPLVIKILLPVGISFYTFQSMAYTIDVYRQEIKPTKNFLSFALFISFFPQLVAGPIERARRLLPQINAPRKIDTGKLLDGSFLILWGFYKKIIIADNIASLINPVFADYANQSGINLLFAVIGFSIQIYCDFSGYSDIARGLCKLMGFDLIINFKLPYFSQNPQEFWQRWHISLSTWLRDYLYIPLGGSRNGHTYRNLFLVMALGGLWHGASWNFVIWGVFHGTLLAGHRYFFKSSPTQLIPFKFMNVVLLNIAVCIGWIFFRSETLDQAIHILTHVSLFPLGDGMTLGYQIFFYMVPLIIIQLRQYMSQDLLFVTKLRPYAQAIWFTLLFMGLQVFSQSHKIEFIYFQF